MYLWLRISDGDDFSFSRGGLRRQGAHRQVTAENDKSVARELKRQGLIPVYVGLEQKKAVRPQAAHFDRGKRRDVSVLHAGAFDAAQCRHSARSRAFDHRRTHRPRARSGRWCIDVLRVLKGGKSLADSLATHPAHFSDLYINMVRAGEASGSLWRRSSSGWPNSSARATICADYIISLHDLSRAAGAGGHRLDPHAAEFRGAAVRFDFFRPAHENSYAHRDACWTPAGWCRPTVAAGGDRAGGRLRSRFRPTFAPWPGACGGTRFG